MFVEKDQIQKQAQQRMTRPELHHRRACRLHTAFYKRVHGCDLEMRAHHKRKNAAHAARVYPKSSARPSEQQVQCPFPGVMYISSTLTTITVHVYQALSAYCAVARANEVQTKARYSCHPPGPPFISVKHFSLSPWAQVSAKASDAFPASFPEILLCAPIDLYRALCESEVTHA